MAVVVVMVAVVVVAFKLLLLGSQQPWSPAIHQSDITLSD